MLIVLPAPTSHQLPGVISLLQWSLTCFDRLVPHLPVFPGVRHDFLLGTWALFLRERGPVRVGDSECFGVGDSYNAYSKVHDYWVLESSLLITAYFCSSPRVKVAVFSPSFTPLFLPFLPPFFLPSFPSSFPFFPSLPLSLPSPSPHPPSFLGSTKVY